MKKVFVFLGLAAMLFTVYACGGNDTTTPPAITTQPSGGGSTTTTTKKNNINLRGEKFKIVSNDAANADPRKSTYKGLYKEEKMENIERVEKEYNCVVEYIPYPVAWGVGRDNWIIENSIAGTPAGHVFEISTSSVAILALKDAILPLDEFITTFDLDDTYPAFIRDYGIFKGKTYTYTDRLPYNDNVIFYNRSLLQELGYTEEQMPANLWLKNEWTWDKYKEYARDLATKFQGTQKYVMTGRNYDWAYQMINVNGGVMVDSNLEVKINSNESIEAMQYIADLYKISDRVFKDDAPMQDTCDQIFKDGSSVFQPGQTWYAQNPSKLSEVPFDLDVVPFPYNRTRDNYNNINIWGAATYVISSSYDIANIKPGYENMFLHGETIFQIWNDLQYFADEEEYQMFYVAQNYEKSYNTEEAINAHIEVMKNNKLDLLYSLGMKAFGDLDCVAYTIEAAMRSDSVRATATSLYESMSKYIEENIIG